MSTGTMWNRMWVRGLGMAVLGAGLVLGGCNNKMKDENQALRSENAELKERVTSCETEKATMVRDLQTVQAENQRMMTTMSQPQPYPTGGDFRPSRPEPREPRARTERIRIAGDVLFASGSTTLKPEAKKELNSHLSQFKNASSIIIEGYTDSDPIKRSPYKTNQALSKARADAVKDYLVSKGVSRSSISTVGKGASDPLATKKESRRVEIVLAE